MNNEGSVTIQLSENHIYEVFDVLVSGKPVACGTLRLFNVLTEELESYVIWAGYSAEEDYFVYLPTGSNKQLEKFHIWETFGIHPVIVSEQREFL
ncbi:hypothetical protein ACFWGC_26950 [Cytobacillus pseudoceanisediminis]|uniref:hypothetical protein n=1 Tax=Cytobacillus pseudoceanisediminis TaxID=3051614 RepID=UPI003660A1F0